MARQEFCRKVDLTAEKPYILFVGSTASISEPQAEIEFVLDWICRIRDADDPALRDAAILIRPHPYNPGTWADVDLSGLGDVAVWPKNGANPVDDRDRQEYFDSLYYAAVVVGVNTTAMIEAAIVDRPVRTIRTDDFRETQGGTLMSILPTLPKRLRIPGRHTLVTLPSFVHSSVPTGRTRHARR